MVTPTVASGDAIALRVRYGTKATDSTGNVQSEYNTVSVTIVNHGGTYGSSSSLGSPLQTLSAGTLVTSWSVSALGVLNLTATSSLTSPTVSVVYHVENFSGCSVAV